MTLNKLKLLCPELLATTSVALEDIADGLARLEKEFVWYGHVQDASVFEGKDYLYQEQCNFKNNDTSVRVRKQYKISGETGQQSGETEYTLTLKSKKPSHDDQSCSEVTTVITKDFFEAFCQMCDEKMIKKRFEIEQEGFKYEIDVATQENRPVTNNDFVKIDIEVSAEQSSDSIPKEVPGIELKVTEDKEKQSEEDKQYIDNIHRNHLSVKTNS